MRTVPALPHSASMRLILLCVTAVTMLAQKSVIVRPVEIDDVLVNPEMGIQTFQRVNGDAINPGSRWSEVGPEKANEAGQGRPDFPPSSLAYYRWFWSQIEPAPGKYNWEPIDLAIERARAQRPDGRLPADAVRPDEPAARVVSQLRRAPRQ